MSSGKDYYTSERFIWDDLIVSSERAVTGLYEHWKRAHRIDDFLITWPAEPVKAEDGSTVVQPCAFTFPANDRTPRQEIILKTIEVTKAYALLLVEELADEIQIILESRHGAKCWTIPIIKTAGARVLGPHAIDTKGRHVGLLWRPTSFTA